MGQGVYQVCYTRYQVLFYLLQNGPLLKHFKDLKHYDQDCRWWFPTTRWHFKIPIQYHSSNLMRHFPFLIYWCLTWSTFHENLVSENSLYDLNLGNYFQSHSWSSFFHFLNYWYNFSFSLIVFDIERSLFYFLWYYEIRHSARASFDVALFQKIL